MCGHVGVAGIIGQKEDKVFRTLLVLDTVRGEHSTGVAVVSAKGEVSVLKTLGDPFQLFEMKSYDKMISHQSNKVLIGHNRFATQGKINRANAHPFEFDTVVGAHNGTLHNKWNLPDHHLYDVDSEALYSTIDKEGLEKAMSYARGAWALVFYNKEKDSVEFLRNKERSLFFVKTKDNRTMFWASEKWMLTAALSRGGIDFEVEDIEEFTTDLHYSFDMSNRSAIAKPRVKKVEGKHPVTTSSPVQSSSSGVGSHTGKTYPSRKTITVRSGEEQEYEATENRRDTRGGRYVVLVDPSNPTKDVRMYQAVDSLLSRRVPCRIRASITVAAMESGRVYYKTNTSSYSFVTILSEEKKEEAVGESPFRTIDHKSGQELDKKELEKRYKECSWCSDVLAYDGSDHVHGSTALCKDCAEDLSLEEYVPSLKHRAAIN